MGVIEVDGDDIVAIYCNASTARFFETEVENIPRRTGEQLGIPKTIDALWVRHYRESQAEGRSYSIRIRTLPAWRRLLAERVCQFPGIRPDRPSTLQFHCGGRYRQKEE